MPTPKTPKPAKPRRKRSENLDVQRMRRFYDAMLRCSRASRNGQARATLGTEVPALLDLRGGDILVVSRATAAIDLLSSGAPRRKPDAQTASTPSLLAVQLGLASGIALRAREERRRALVVVFAEVADRNSWRDALALASERKLPLLFFLFARGSGLDTLLADANAAGVASMIVDAADSVAVYRVCQEAQLRARMGDGPAFIIGHLASRGARPDPLASLREFLTDHKYPVDEWHAASSRRAARRKPSGKTKRKKRRTKSASASSPFQIITIRR
jgi:TPP-dependent pyruvate/acetoin dehydrogenase alpha subunit